jgi:hypothetical protein
MKGELLHDESSSERLSEGGGLMERVVERDNLLRALKRVKRNGGSSGIDG